MSHAAGRMLSSSGICSGIFRSEFHDICFTTQVMRLLGMSAEELSAAETLQRAAGGGSTVQPEAKPARPSAAFSASAQPHTFPARPGPASAHPSDMILKLAAGATKGRSDAGAAQAAAAPGRVDLRQPLQSGVAGDQLLSPAPPVPSPTFWQPFGVGAQQGGLISRGGAGGGNAMRPVSAPSPKRAWVGGGGPFDNGTAHDEDAATALPKAEQSEWRAFDDSSSPDAARAQMASWQPFSSNGSPSVDAWGAHGPLHSVSVPMDWAGNVAHSINRTITAPAMGGAVAAGHARSRSQTSDLLSTWPHRSLKDGACTSCIYLRQCHMLGTFSRRSIYYS